MQLFTITTNACHWILCQNYFVLLWGPNEPNGIVNLLLGISSGATKNILRYVQPSFKTFKEHRTTAQLHLFSFLFCYFLFLQKPFLPFGCRRRRRRLRRLAFWPLVMCRLFVPPSLVHSKFKSCLLTPSRFYKPFLLFIVPFIQLFYFSLLLLLPL